VNFLNIFDIYYMEKQITITKRINIGPALYVALMILVYTIALAV